VNNDVMTAEADYAIELIAGIDSHFVAAAMLSR